MKFLILCLAIGVCVAFPQEGSGGGGSGSGGMGSHEQGSWEDFHSHEDGGDHHGEEPLDLGKRAGEHADEVYPCKEAIQNFKQCVAVKVGCNEDASKRGPACRVKHQTVLKKIGCPVHKLVGKKLNYEQRIEVAHCFAERFPDCHGKEVAKCVFRHRCWGSVMGFAHCAARATNVKTEEQWHNRFGACEKKHDEEDGEEEETASGAGSGAAGSTAKKSLREMHGAHQWGLCVLRIVRLRGGDCRREALWAHVCHMKKHYNHFCHRE